LPDSGCAQGVVASHGAAPPPPPHTHTPGPPCLLLGVRQVKSPPHVNMAPPTARPRLPERRAKEPGAARASSMSAGGWGCFVWGGGGGVWGRGGRRGGGGLGLEAGCLSCRDMRARPPRTPPSWPKRAHPPSPDAPLLPCVIASRATAAAALCHQPTPTLSTQWSLSPSTWQAKQQGQHPVAPMATASLCNP
jgi:hypothetical protein